MPIQFEMREDEGYFVSRYIGTIQDAEFQDAYNRFHKERDAAHLHELADLSEGDLNALSADALWSQAVIANDRNARLRHNPKRTAVYAPESLAIGLAHMFAAQVDEEQHQLRVFQDRQSALNWMIGTSPRNGSSRKVVLHGNHG